jgi:hypothetical protein
VIGETLLNGDHIIKMYSIELIEHARKETGGRGLASRAVKIELSSVDRTI